MSEYKYSLTFSSERILQIDQDYWQSCSHG